MPGGKPVSGSIVRAHLKVLLRPKVDYDPPSGPLNECVKRIECGKPWMTMYLPSAVTKQSEVQAAVDEVERNLAPDVVRIRYEIGEDWSGQWAIFFRIVLTDEAARRRLRDVGAKVVWGLAQQLDLPAMGVFRYHNFRSVSEQEALQEPAWV
jgi:hypothetical protein